MKYPNLTNKAILLAIMAGLLAIAPVVYFRYVNADSYKGMPFFPIDDEEFYLTRMQEITDGHPLAGSMFFYEAKDLPPLMAPTADYVYVGVSKILHTSLPTAMVILKFVFPAVLFLLVYSLALKLTRDRQEISEWVSLLCATTVVFGFDLVGLSLDGGFMLWARPVNPIFGAIFLFLFLNTLVDIYLGVKPLSWKKIVLGAVLPLALMISSYFFSWTLAVIIMGLTFILMMGEKRYKEAAKLIYVLFGGIVLATPYWILFFKARGYALYQEAAIRFGLIFTHQPLGNKLLFLAIPVFAIIWFVRRNRGEGRFFKFGLISLFAGLIALNQQVITGQTVWPFHYVSYTIPLVYIFILIALARLVGDKLTKHVKVASIVLVVLVVGICSYRTTLAYKSHEDLFVARQEWMPVFNWINANTATDSVFLVDPDTHDFETFIPAYTHSYVYTGESGYMLIPHERFVHNYLVYLRLRGIKEADLSEYIKNNFDDTTQRLYTNIFLAQHNNSFGTPPDPVFDQTIKDLPVLYSTFLKQPFRSELEKYKLDYLVSKGELENAVWLDLDKPAIIAKINGYAVYDLRKNK